jgi:hypothetical protein
MERIFSFVQEEAVSEIKTALGLSPFAVAGGLLLMGWFIIAAIILGVIVVFIGYRRSPWREVEDYRRGYERERFGGKSTPI